MIRAAIREFKNLSSPETSSLLFETLAVVALSAFGLGLIFLADFFAKNLIFRMI